MEISRFIKYLKKHKGMLTKKQFKTLKGQALSGNINGAEKGIQKIIERSFCR